MHTAKQTMADSDPLQRISQAMLVKLPLTEAQEADIASLTPETINAVLPSGMTLLGTACYHRRTPIIKALLKNGASTRALDEYGLLPCDWMTGAIRPTNHLKTHFTRGYHHMTYENNAHDDYVLYHILNELLKAGHASPKQKPYFSSNALNWTSRFKKYYPLVKHCICTCAQTNPDDCVCVTMPEYISSAINEHGTDGDINMLVDYLHTVQ